jgi:hypothetical protein
MARPGLKRGLCFCISKISSLTLSLIDLEARQVRIANGQTLEGERGVLCNCGPIDFLGNHCASRDVKLADTDKRTQRENRLCRYRNAEDRRRARADPVQCASRELTFETLITKFYHPDSGPLSRAWSCDFKVPKIHPNLSHCSGPESRVKTQDEDEGLGDEGTGRRRVFKAVNPLGRCARICPVQSVNFNAANFFKIFVTFLNSIWVTRQQKKKIRFIAPQPSVLHATIGPTNNPRLDTGNLTSF